MKDFAHLQVYFTSEHGANYIGLKNQNFGPPSFSNMNAWFKYFITSDGYFRFYLEIEKLGLNNGWGNSDEVGTLNLDYFYHGQKLFMSCSDDEFKVEPRNDIGLNQYFKVTPAD